MFGLERGQKPLQCLVIWRFTYAKTGDSQPSLEAQLRARNGSRFILKTGSENLHRLSGAYAINMLKYVPLRQ
ncbi:MAG: hypothetical protein WAV72_09670 [Bradyrhizobium sp.]